MFEEAPYEKIERLRRTFRQTRASVDHINKEKLRQLNNLITFTKYICEDLRNLPPVLSRYLIYATKKITHRDISKFPSAAFRLIQQVQDYITLEEEDWVRFLKDEKEIADGKDSVIFDDAKMAKDNIMSSLDFREEKYLQVNLLPWYENLHKSVKLAIDAVYRKFAEREGYLHYLLPLEVKLRRALKILKRITLIIEHEKREVIGEVEKLEKIEQIAHEKFAFAR